jgi:hypothetical protein
MFKKTLALLLSTAAIGCGAPNPEGFELTNAEPAVRALLAAHGAEGRGMPRVWGVHLDPGCTVQTPLGPGIRFRDPADDVCVSGLQVGGDIWIVWDDGLRYSHSALSHEIVHWLDGDDRHRQMPLWESRSGAASKEVAGRAALQAMGQGDVIKLF